jgi:very-short-patch-repair endonuclease
MDWELNPLATAQHGAVARHQLRAAGHDRRWEHRQVRAGRLELATPRVLRIAGSPRTALQTVIIGVLDAGPGANVSHDTGAWLFGLGRFRPSPVHVMTFRDSYRVPTPGVIVHEPRHLLPHHLTTVVGIPTTSVVRTVIELAATIHPKRLERLVHQVVKASPGSLPIFHQVFGEICGRGKTGTVAMRDVLSRLPIGSVPAESGTELEFMDILRSAGEPPLRRQVDYGGQEFIGRLDFVDDELDIVFEIDSRTHHQILPDDRANDIERDRVLDDHGRRVTRIPDGLIWRNRPEVLRIVRNARRERRAELLVEKTSV